MSENVKITRAETMSQDFRHIVISTHQNVEMSRAETMCTFSLRKKFVVKKCDIRTYSIRKLQHERQKQQRQKTKREKLKGERRDVNHEISFTCCAVYLKQ